MKNNFVMPFAVMMLSFSFMAGAYATSCSTSCHNAGCDICNFNECQTACNKSGDAWTKKLAKYYCKYGC